MCLMCEESRESVDVMGAQEEKEKERKGRKKQRCACIICLFVQWRVTRCIAMTSLHGIDQQKAIVSYVRYHVGSKQKAVPSLS